MQSFTHDLSVFVPNILYVSACVFGMFVNKVVSLALALVMKTLYFSFLVFGGVSAAFIKIQN